METNRALVAHIISAERVLHGYWTATVRADIRCRWTKPSAPGQSRPKPAQAIPGDGGGEDESFGLVGLVTAVAVGMESNHLPAGQDERNYDAFVDRRAASPEQGRCLAPSRACGRTKVCATDFEWA